MQANYHAVLLDLVGVLLRADREKSVSNALHNEGIEDAFNQAMVEALKLLGPEGVTTIAHRFETQVPEHLLTLLADEAGKTFPQTIAAPAPEDDTFGALQLLLSDVEGVACCRNAYGMEVENEDHPFHVSVLRARAALRRRREMEHAASADPLPGNRSVS